MDKEFKRIRALYMEVNKSESAGNRKPQRLETFMVIDKELSKVQLKHEHVIREKNEEIEYLKQRNTHLVEKVVAKDSEILELKKEIEELMKLEEENTHLRKRIRFLMDSRFNAKHKRAFSGDEEKIYDFSLKSFQTISSLHERTPGFEVPGILNSEIFQNKIKGDVIETSSTMNKWTNSSVADKEEKSVQKTEEIDFNREVKAMKNL